MSKMVERVAWPIACELMELTAEQRAQYTPDDINGDTWDRAMSAARATIEVMREPTDEMDRVGDLTIRDAAFGSTVWSAMIDAALVPATR